MKTPPTAQCASVFESVHFFVCGIDPHTNVTQKGTNQDFNQEPSCWCYNYSHYCLSDYFFLTEKSTTVLIYSIILHMDFRFSLQTAAVKPGSHHPQSQEHYPSAGHLPQATDKKIKRQFLETCTADLVIVFFAGNQANQFFATLTTEVKQI